jgi:hypothetical protein
MELRSINNRADLDAIAGTQEHEAFMALLAGSLWRLEKDDDAMTWRAIEDSSTVARFGFDRDDFPNAQPPALPPYVPPPSAVPQAVTMRQARLALLSAGLLDQVNAAITDPAARIEWEYATTVERNSSLVQSLASGLGLTEPQLDDLFTLAATL